MAVTDQSTKKTKRKNLSKSENSSVNAKDSFSHKKRISMKDTKASETEDGFDTDLDTPLFKKPVSTQPIKSTYATQNGFSDSAGSETDMDKPPKQAKSSGKSASLPKPMNSIHSQSEANHSESDDERCSVSLLQMHSAKMSPIKKSYNPDIGFQKSNNKSLLSGGVKKNKVSRSSVIPDMSPSESESEEEEEQQQHNLQSEFQPQSTPPTINQQKSQSEANIQRRSQSQPRSEPESKTEIQPRLQNRSLSSNLGQLHGRTLSESQHQSESETEIQHKLANQSLSAHLTQSQTRTESKSEAGHLHPRTSNEGQPQDRNPIQTQSQSESESESETDPQSRSQNWNQFQPEPTIRPHIEKETEQELHLSSLQWKDLTPPASILEKDKSSPSQSVTTPVLNLSLFEKDHTPISAPSFDVPPDSNVWVLQVPRDVPAAHLLGQKMPSILKGDDFLGPPEASLQIVEQPYDSSKNSLNFIFSTGSLCYGMRWIKPSAFWHLRRPPIKIRKETAKLHWGEEISPLPIKELLKMKTNHAITEAKCSKRERNSNSEKNLSKLRIQNTTVEAVTSNLQSPKKKKRKSHYLNESDSLVSDPSIMEATSNLQPPKKKKRKSLYLNESDSLVSDPSITDTSIDHLSSKGKQKKHRSSGDLTKKSSTKERKRKRPVDPDSDTSPAKKKKKRVHREDSGSSSDRFNSPVEKVTTEQKLTDNEYDECAVKELKPKDFTNRQEKKKKNIKIAQELVLSDKRDETMKIEQQLPTVALKGRDKKHNKKKPVIHKSEESFQEPEMKHIEEETEIAKANVFEKSVPKKKKKKERK